MGEQGLAKARNFFKRQAMTYNSIHYVFETRIKDIQQGARTCNGD